MTCSLGNAAHGNEDSDPERKCVCLCVHTGHRISLECVMSECPCMYEPEALTLCAPVYYACKVNG